MSEGRETSAPHDQYVIGVELGARSTAAVVVRARDGAELGSAAGTVPSADAGEGPDHWQAVLESAVPDAVSHAGVNPAWVIGIGVAARSAGAADRILAELTGGGPGAPDGRLTAEAAEWTGLPESIAVAAAGSTAHATVAAARAVDDGTLLVLLEDGATRALIAGPEIETPEDVAVVADRGGREGAAGFEIEGHALDDGQLDDAAFAEPAGAHGLVALAPDRDGSGVVVGIRADTSAGQLARAAVESTVFGLRAAVDALAMAGVPATEIVVAGALRDRAELQRVIGAVLRLPVAVLATDHGAAVGAAIHAAVAAGAHPTLAAAARVMGRLRDDTVWPDEGDADVYDELHAEYRLLQDHFGLGGNDVLQRLAALRREVLAP